MRKNNLPIKCELLSCRARGLFTVSVLWAAAVAVKQLSSYGAIQTSVLNHLSLNPGLPWKDGDDQEFREGGLGREEEGEGVQEM